VPKKVFEESKGAPRKGRKKKRRGREYKKEKEGEPTGGTQTGLITASEIKRTKNSSILSKKKKTAAGGGGEGNLRTGQVWPHNFGGGQKGNL